MYLFCFFKSCTFIKKAEIPDQWKAAALSHVDITINENTLGLLKNQGCNFSDGDFCVIEDERSSDGTYVNLLKNPEAFTGYAGDSAARIWNAIYKENCFEAEGEGVGGGAASNIGGGLIGAVRSDNTCMEKRVFYRLISGLHASISTHLCDRFLDQKTGQWVSLLSLGFHFFFIVQYWFAYIENPSWG